jgi:hypothetical protein
MAGEAAVEPPRRRVERPHISESRIDRGARGEHDEQMSRPASQSRAQQL